MSLAGLAAIIVIWAAAAASAFSWLIAYLENQP